MTYVDLVLKVSVGPSDGPSRSIHIAVQDGRIARRVTISREEAKRVGGRGHACHACLIDSMLTSSKGLMVTVCIRLGGVYEGVTTIVDAGARLCTYAAPRHIIPECNTEISPL